MKNKLALSSLIYFAATTFAQSSSAIESPLIAASCGNRQTNFKSRKGVQLPKPEASPENGKALVYIFSAMNNTEFSPGCVIISRVGIDGRWLGANCGSSYLSEIIPAGDHHLCADYQTGLLATPFSFSPPLPALAHLTAKSGEIYYFRFRILYLRGVIEYSLDPIDADEGKLLLATDAPSISSPKK